jgi:hypothetical protein
VLYFGVLGKAIPSVCFFGGMSLRGLAMAARRNARKPRGAEPAKFEQADAMNFSPQN